MYLPWFLVVCNVSIVINVAEDAGREVPCFGVAYCVRIPMPMFVTNGLVLEQLPYIIIKSSSVVFANLIFRSKDVSNELRRPIKSVELIPWNTFWQFAYSSFRICCICTPSSWRCSCFKNRSISTVDVTTHKTRPEKLTTGKCKTPVLNPILEYKKYILFRLSALVLLLSFLFRSTRKLWRTIKLNW